MTDSVRQVLTEPIGFANRIIGIETRPTALPRALVPLRGKVYYQGSRFPETATTSLGVLQPWPLPSSRLVSQELRCHDHIPTLRTTCRTAAASPRTIPRNAGAHINQAAGHAIIWGGTRNVRHDAQGACHGELSVPHRRGHVCAIDGTLTNEPTATACARGARLPWEIRLNRPA